MQLIFYLMQRPWSDENVDLPSFVASSDHATFSFFSFPISGQSLDNLDLTLFFL